jgi:methyl-accepting chemotaxis protein
MKLPSFTIGRKIGIGFFIVFVIFTIVAAVAWFALGSAGTGLKNYSSSTVETNLAAQLEVSMLTLS